MLYALCGLSGTGKTTIVKELLNKRPQLSKLTTFTTRSLRYGEIDGSDYRFVSRKYFEEMVQTGQIVCPIIYREELYGTLVTDLLACVNAETISVLRPDKLPCIRKDTPIIGIYREMPKSENPLKPEDKVIYENKQMCSYFVPNIPGTPGYAVELILSLIDRGGIR